MNNEYRVTDIYLNAYLRAKGFKEINIGKEVTNGREIVVFIYEETERLRDYIQEFIDNNLVRSCIRELQNSKREIAKLLAM